MLHINRSKAYTLDNIIKRKIKKDSNLFVISNLGQLNHVESLIRKFCYKNNVLIVVYTEANYHVPQLIHDQFSDEFSSVIFLKLPKSPNSYNFNNLVKIYKSYRRVILKVRPKKIFLNSFQHHYAVFASIAKKKNIQLFLVEEGLGTYRLGALSPKEIQDNQHGKLDVNLIKKISKNTLEKSEIFNRSSKIVEDVNILIKQSKIFASQLYLHPETQKFLIGNFPNKNLKAFLTPFLDFDFSYTTFPEKTQKIFSSAHHYFYSTYEEQDEKQISYAKNIINFYGISNNDVLYLSQHYQIDSQEYLDIVYNIFSNLLNSSCGRIYVKLHPKNEKKEVFEGFLSMEKKSDGRIRIIRESGFLIEEVIRQSQIKSVIGITSSALVYSCIVSPNIQAYSVADILLRELDRKNKNNNKGIKMLKQHAQILRQFNNIVFLGS